jgi:hypothetical protein
MARKKNAAEIKEPDEYRGLVRLAMLDFRGRHQRKPHDFEEFLGMVPSVRRRRIVP